MILLIFATVLILGIGFFQMQQGFFSALILAVITLISTAFAMTTYETLAAATNFYDTLPHYADAICILLLFCVPMFLLRFLTDKFVHSDILMPMILDKAGAVVLGLLTGTMMMGVLIVSLQLLPFERAIFTYRPFKDTLVRSGVLYPFAPDDFVVGLTETISAGSMSGRRSYRHVHDDLLLETFCWRNTSIAPGTSRKTGPGAAELFAVCETGMWWDPVARGFSNGFGGAQTPVEDAILGQVAPYAPLVDDDSRLVILRVRVNNAARDEDGWWRLPATHFRLLTQDKQGRRLSIYPIGYVYYNEVDAQWKVETPPSANNTAQPVQLFLARPKDAGYDDWLYIDWIYQLPETAIPEALYFRRTVVARPPARVPADQEDQYADKMYGWKDNGYNTEVARRGGALKEKPQE
jgi:hypothetical protein